jgi:PucR family transcriptional regulator, purine catabolism regulatory protein
VAAELWNGLPDSPVALVTCRGRRFAIGAAVERLLADREVAARPVLQAQLDGGLVCVAAAADIDVVLTALQPVDGLRVGVSDPAERDELRQARAEADRAADAAGVGSGATVVRFRDIPRSGLLDVLASPAVTELSHRLLAPLRNDPAARVDMLRSLTAWLAHHGQWEPAAGELGIHRHTLRSRIQRAESLLGRRLDSPDLRAELWVALRSAHPATRDPQLSDRMS